MAKGTQEVSAGRFVINTAGTAFADINETIQTVAEKAQEMSYVMEKLVQENKEVLTVISQITQSSMKTAEHTLNISASAEEELAAMQEMAAFSRGLAQELKVAARVFRT